jgi:hypothetical protein
MTVCRLKHHLSLLADVYCTYRGVGSLDLLSAEEVGRLTAGKEMAQQAGHQAYILVETHSRLLVKVESSLN